jgi:hypothetical protein
MELPTISYRRAFIATNETKLESLFIVCKGRAARMCKWSIRLGKQQEEMMKLGTLLTVLTVLLGSSATGGPPTVNGLVDNIYELESLFWERQNLNLTDSQFPEDVGVSAHEIVTSVDWSEFPPSFTRLMYAQIDANGTPFYRVSVYEDPVTRETVFLNSYGSEIYRLLPGAHSYSNGEQITTGQVSDIPELSALKVGPFNSSPFVVKFTLIPKALFADVLETQEEMDALEATMMTIGMRSLQTPLTNLYMAICSTTHGAVGLEIKWPSSFTNDLEIFATVDLTGQAWQVVTSNIPTSSTTNYFWTDWASTNTPTRFYMASNADIDSDGDHLADGLEIYVYGTNPNSQHSDNDGIADDVELGASPPTDPLNDDNQTPVVLITLPVNNIVVVP